MYAVRFMYELQYHLHFNLINIRCIIWCSLQNSLGGELSTEQYRHVCNYLLCYCVRATASPPRAPSNPPQMLAFRTTESLLNEVIISIGYFTSLNTENQVGYSFFSSYVL